MKTKTTAKYLTFAVLMPMLIMAFAAAPAQAKSPDLKLVDNVKIDAMTIDLDQIGLTPEQLQMLSEIIPADLMFLENVQYIYIDGTAHINAMVKEKKDSFDVNLHITWHGTIALLDSAGNTVVSIDSKNIQLVAHADIPANGDLSQTDLWLNFHTNSVLFVGDGSSSSEVDLKVHVIVSFSDGQCDMIKVQLPQFLDAALF